MASYDSILETTAVRVIVDDDRVKSQLSKVRQEAQKTYTALAKSQRASAGATRQAERANDGLSESIRTNARLALTLRREYENGIIPSSQEFRRQAEALRSTLLKQATQVDRTTREYDRAQLGAQRLSTAMATAEGRTSKLGFSANVTTGVVAGLANRLRATGPAGGAAAAGLTAFSGAAGVASRAARSFGRYLSTQLVPIFATFAGIAGVGIATRALNGFVKSSFEAEVQLRLFNRELSNAGRTTAEGADTLTRLAQQFRTTEDAVAAGGVQLLRYGATLEQTEALLRSGGASALAFGRTTSAGFEAIAQAIVGEQSQVLNRIGIAGNLSTAYKRYADDLGTTSDALTRQQKVQAALNLILEETQGEIEALDELLDGYGGALSEVQKQQALTARALGDEFRPAITQVLEATAQFLEVFRTQMIPVLRDQFGPAIEGVTDNIRGFLDVLQDPDGNVGALAQSITDAIGPVIRLGAAFAGLLSGARAAISGILGEVAYFGAYVGTISTDWGRWANSRSDAMQLDLMGLTPEEAAEMGFNVDTGFEAQATAAAEAARAPFQERRQAALESGDFWAQAFLDTTGTVEDLLRRLQAARTSASTSPSALGAPGNPDTPTAPGGAGTPSDFNRLVGSSEGFTRSELETQRLLAGVLSAQPGDFFPAANFPQRLARGGDGGAAVLVRIANTEELARGIRAMQGDREPLRRANELLGGRAARGDGGLALARSRLNLNAAIGTISGQLAARAGRGDGGLGAVQIANSALSRLALEADDAARNLASAQASAAFEPQRRAAFNAGVGALSLQFGARAARGDGGLSDLTFNQGIGGISRDLARRTDRGDGGLAEVVAANQQAADAFASEVVSSAFEFSGALVDSIRSGDIGKAFEGLLSAGGGILGSANLGSLPFLGGSIGIGSLLSGGLGILGSVFGGLFGGGNESPAVNSAQSGRTITKLELNYTVNQQNELGLLNDPMTTQRLAELNDESFRRLEDILRRSILPDLNAVKERVGLT